MLQTLVNLGFKEHEAEVYVLLALNGPKSAKDIAGALGSYKRKVYRTITKLQKIGIAAASASVPAGFSVVSFDKVLDRFIDSNLAQAKNIETKKDQLLSLWSHRVKEI